MHTDNNGDYGGTADLIRGNNVSDCTNDGYGVWTFAPFLTATVQENTVTNCSVGLAAARANGAGPVSTTFIDNTVDGQNLANSTGVYVTTDGFGWGSTDVNATFTGNTIINNTDGFSIEAQATYTATVSATDNAIYGNANVGATTVGLGTHAADFSGNWWGSADAATVKAQADGGAVIDYTPWLDSGTDTSGDPGFQGDFSNLHVDDDSPQTGATGRIQEGIDLVTGSTVNVADGTYTATSLASIVITKDGLSLVGQSRDGTIIDSGAWGTSNAGWPKGIHVYANDVTIQDLTVRGFTGDMITTGGYGIVFRDYAHDMPGEGWIFYTGSVVDNVKVENNYSAIYALVNRNLTVRDSLIQNNFSDGMFIARESDNATITGNTVLNSGDHGIWVGYDWGALGPSDNAIITGNVVDGAREGGISFVASDTALISANDVSNVKGEEPEGAGGWSRGAISLKDGVSNVTVSNNVVHDNDGLGTGSGRGIGVDGTSSNITVTGNVIRNNAGGGIKVQGTTTGWTANYNSIYSNTGYGAENTTGSILDFEKNWWGDATGADHASNPHGTGQGGDAVSDDVDFTPWYATSTTTPGTENVTVTHNPVIAVSDTIQDAIAAALDGDTVAVGAGNYTENVSVNKDVTLVGVNPPEGGSAAVVNGTVDLTAGGATVDSLKVVPGSVTGNERAIAVYAGNTTVTGNLIDGMTGDGTGSIYGVGVYGGSKPALLNINVTYNVIKNIDNPLGTPYGGATGIQVQGVLDDVDIIGNTIQDIHSAGWAFGIEVTPTAADSANPPQNVLVQLNNITLVNDGSVYNVLLAPLAAPYPGVGFSLDEVSPGSDDGDASQVIVKNNSFVALIVGAINKDTDQILNAESNWWGACDGPSGEGPGSGAYVGTNIDFDPWDATKCDKDSDFLTDDEEIFIYGTDPNNPDTDGDGCLDGVEVLPASIAANGGGRDPLNPWDFYDVDGLGGSPDGTIDLFFDILGVILHYSLDGSSPYDVQFDRGPSAGPNPWNMTAPDGSIDLFVDILGVIKQYGHDCT